LKDSPGIVLALARSGEILFQNRAYEDLPDSSAPPSPSKEVILSACQRALESGEAQDFEMGIMDLAGPAIWYQCNVRTTKDSDENLTLAIAICLEITERIQTEKRLRESEARKTAILDSAVDSIVTMDFDGKLLEINAAAEATFGYSQSYAHGKELAQLMIPARLRDSFRAELVRCRAAGDEHAFVRKLEYSATRADGTEFPVEVSIARLQSAYQQVFTGFIQDISIRKRAEEQIHQYSNQLKVLADISRSFAEARLDLNRTLDITVRKLAEYFQEGCFVRLFSEDQSEISTKAVYHGDPELHELMKRVLLGSRTFIDETSGNELLKTGKPILFAGTAEQARLRIKPQYWSYLERYPVHTWIIAPLRVAGRLTGSVTVFRFKRGPLFSSEDQAFLQELADRAALSVDNAQLYLDAQRAIQLREDFISIASHELKTPLTPLKMQLQLLSHLIRTGVLVTTSKTEDLQKLLSDSGLQIIRLTRLIEDMLDASRLRTGHLTLNREEFDLSSLVADVVDRFRPQLSSAKCTVELQTAPLIRGAWDKPRLEQVVANLLSNALKYGPGKPIRVTTSIEEPYAILAVQDFGMGITEEDQAKLFQRFGRVASVKQFGGLGMGLYISREIVEAHGGRIHLKSAPGEGSTFTVEIPLRP